MLPSDPAKHEEYRQKMVAMRTGENNPCWKGGTSQDPVYKAQYCREWRKRNEDHVRDREYQKKFGITLADYNEMLIKQHGCCAICDARPGRRRLNVDHDHETGKVRGLLCDTCNQVLGKFDDNVEILEQAVLYLKTYASRKSTTT